MKITATFLPLLPFAGFISPVTRPWRSRAVSTWRVLVSAWPKARRESSALSSGRFLGAQADLGAEARRRPGASRQTQQRGVDLTITGIFTSGGCRAARSATRSAVPAKLQ